MGIDVAKGVLLERMADLFDVGGGSEEVEIERVLCVIAECHVSEHLGPWDARFPCASRCSQSLSQCLYELHKAARQADRHSYRSSIGASVYWSCCIHELLHT
eukprot:COSAG02_NODE_3093_length_7383_cov_2.908018_8_plen_102_part_00